MPESVERPECVREPERHGYLYGDAHELADDTAPGSGSHLRTVARGGPGPRAGTQGRGHPLVTRRPRRADRTARCRT
ncbi:MAG: hypothetical protein M3Y17_15955, partial [Actinomycetota bacterium]|nr:hypothetical protein [Actinomycetota bacterium]